MSILSKLSELKAHFPHISTLCKNVALHMFSAPRMIVLEGILLATRYNYREAVEVR
jgi:hypothetical protein